MSRTARALVVTICLLGTWGYLARASRAETLPRRASLALLPYAIDGWRGVREPDFEPRIVKVLGVDDYTIRRYARGTGPQLGLYIGYHDSQRERDTVHSPLNCLPGAGWIPIASGHRELRVSDPAGTPRVIEVNRVLIEKGIDRQVVFYWYQSHGRVVASEYWGKIYTVVDAIRLNRTDTAIVRVVVPLSPEDGDGSGAGREAEHFIESLFPLLGSYLPA
jgi:EpsI family protein